MMEEVFGAVGKKCTPRSSHSGAKQLPSLAPDLARGTEPHTGAWDPPGQLLGAALGLPGWGSHSSMRLCSTVHGCMGSRGGLLQALGCPEEPPVLPINNSQLLMSSKHPEGHN